MSSISDLSLKSLTIYALALVVALAWNSAFDSLFNYIRYKYLPENDKGTPKSVHIVYIRFGYALLLTLLSAFIFTRWISKI